MARTIAVGLGGAGGWQALAWATEEALSDGSRLLLLLRVCPSCSPLAQLTGEPPAARLERADPDLTRALAQAGNPLVDQRVLRILLGDPGPALTEAAAGADLLVIGSQGGGRTVRQVVRHARRPVVVVHGTPGDRGAMLADHVVVGVDGTATGRAALEFAFSYADEHHLPIAAAHVSAAGDRPGGSHAGSVRGTVDPAEVDRLRAEVEPWSSRYPRTPIRRVLLHGTVTDGLVRAGIGAHLLVVGDRHPSPVTRVGTGDVPWSVARGADCPVAVVPVERRERALL